VALQIAIRHPERVRKLVFASSMTKKDDASPQFWSFIEQADFSTMPQPLKEAFLKVNPDPQKLRSMHDKDLERMRNFKDVSDRDIRSVSASTLILAGDQDIPTPQHAVELTRTIPHARLLIVPGGLGDYLGEAIAAPRESRYPELVADLTEEFLDAG
jgi:pimeloyl-ACP methyl ester carboxylesterase